MKMQARCRNLLAGVENMCTVLCCGTCVCRVIVCGGLAFLFLLNEMEFSVQPYILG
eukprot:TRINITY_DN3254_c0_g4_i3.p1 TRINITY_DN3254_c0_g4~~TRINITY_DN3254_c0_g4_i3.p1  ORF type:complete len:56 (+),score=6.06 TRINITY_DN3254_c0_g4_i3:600-767(+)